MIELVRELFVEGGPVMVAIAVTSLVAWIAVALKWADLRRKLPIEHVIHAAADDRWEEADRAALGVASPEGDVLREFVHASGAPRSEFRAIATPLVDAAHGRMMAGLTPIAALAGLLPLLGLLGTVLGMLHTFEAIQAHGTGDARMLADGIRQALLTTQAGLCAAVPVLLLLRYLRSKATRLATALELAAHHLGRLPVREVA